MQRIKVGQHIEKQRNWNDPKWLNAVVIPNDYDLVTLGEALSRGAKIMPSIKKYFGLMDKDLE